MTDSTSQDSGYPSESVRTLASFLLFVHLFCAVAALSNHVFPSDLLGRLAAIVSPYTRTLQLDPTYASLRSSFGRVSPFYRALDDDDSRRPHQWQVISDGVITHRYPGAHFPAGFIRDRFDTFARLSAAYVTGELDDHLAEIARSLSRLAGLGTTQREVLVRLVRYDGKADLVHSLASDPEVTTLYQADAWVGESGTLHVLKRMEVQRTALPVPATP